MSRTSSLLLAGAVLAAALAPAAVAGAAPQGKADKAKAEHERIVAYWTPERMKAAKPRDFERLPDGSFRQVAAPKGKPSGGSKGKPGGDSGGGGTTSDSLVPITSGSSWEAGGQVLARTGKVYFTMGGSGYVCSGAVADDGDTTGKASIVLTAAHCVNDQTEADGSGWARNWIFIPDFDTKSNLSTSDCASVETVYGCWTAQALVANEGFTTAGGFSTEATQYDFAFAVVGAGGKGGGQQLDAVVGGYPLSFDLDSKASLSAFGYPAAGRYSGNDLTYCSGSLVTDPYNGVSGARDNWGLACKMTGGSSGGPWLITETTSDAVDSTLNASGNGGTLGSLNSYGYSGVRYMFGPVLDANAKAVYEVAKAGPYAGATGGIGVPKA